MKNFNYLKEVKENLNSIIELHSKMRNSYFWNPPKNASSRRNFEKQNSDSYNFKIGNDEIKLQCNTSCSCNHIYYKGVFYINNSKVTIAKIKNLYDALNLIV
jgi:hypothetical protein